MSTDSPISPKLAPLEWKAFLALALLLPSPALFAQSSPSAISRLAHAVDATRTVTLRGNTRREAKAANDRGRVADDRLFQHLQLVLRRSPEQEKALQQFLLDVNDRASPSYHKWLTAAQVGERFGLAESEITAVTSWLQDSGFSVNAVSPSSTFIDFSGNARALRRAFHTEIHHLNVHGKAHLANMSDPQIPAALAGIVKGVSSLNDFRPRPQHTAIRAAANAAPAATTSNGLTLVAPADLATIYHFSPLFRSGISGQGQTVLVIEDTDLYTVADWFAFRRRFGLAKAFPDATLSQIHPAPGTGGACADPGANGDDVEAAIDVQWASAAAPSANIVLASCDNTDFNFGGFVAMENLLTSGSVPSPIISISYGAAETELGSAGNAYINDLYQLAALEGVSVYVSAGDSGADGNDSDRAADIATNGINASGFSSTPYNVSVGGTDYQDTYLGQTSTYWNTTNTASGGSAKSYIPEIPWNDSCGSELIATFVTGSPLTYGSGGFCNSSFASDNGFLNMVAGSGGPSTCALGDSDPATPGTVSGSCAGQPKPDWQSVFGNPSDGVRDQPDVSLFAANGVWGHGYLFCYSDPAFHGIPCNQGFFLGGGTSFSAPILASVQALVNQKTKTNWGNPNPVLYSLGNAQYGVSGNAGCDSSLGNGISPSCSFNDVTQGDMTVYCQAGSPNCFAPSGQYGVLSTSTTAYEPAFRATPGWDFATGLGTINATNFVNAWASGSTQ